MESSCANKFQVTLPYLTLPYLTLPTWLNFVFRQMNSLFWCKQFPVPVVRELWYKAMKLLNKLKVQIAKMAANLKNALLFSLMSGNSRDRCRAVAYDGLPTRVIAWLTDNPAST